VEPAHQAAIHPRDVKPANILPTTYGEPALTDFGIAGGADGEGLSSSQGVSIPFAAPEVLSGATVGDELSDVYSLAATVYALLAGRAPFSTGEAMSELELIERVLNAPLPPTGRADIPPSLERALTRALARDPGRRPESAVAFGRALQGVEAELGLAQTPLRIADTSAVPPPAPVDGDDDSTRFRGVQRVDPEGPPAAAITAVPPSDRSVRPATPRPAADWEPATRPGDDGGLGDRTVHRQPTPTPSAAEPDAAPEPSASSGRGRLVATALGLAVVVAAVVFVISKAGDEPDDPPATSTTETTSSLVVVGAPPRPTDVRIEATGTGAQEVTWEVPSQAEGDTYLVFVTQGPAALEGSSLAAEDLSATLETEERVCVTVETVREGRVSPASTEVCSP
ncbi:MAG: serine/threonine protein kinase, partial [Actinomycetota bacterium]